MQGRWVGGADLIRRPGLSDLGRTEAVIHTGYCYLH
jgi:hypothetical protein